MDAVVDGSCQMSFTHFGSGHSHAFGGTHLELQPGQRIRYNASSHDPNLPGELQTTIVLTPVCCDVEVHNMRQGIPLLTPALN